MMSSEGTTNGDGRVRHWPCQLAQRMSVGSDTEFGAKNLQRLSIFRGLLRRIKWKSEVNPSFGGRESW